MAPSKPVQETLDLRGRAQRQAGGRAPPGQLGVVGVANEACSRSSSPTSSAAWALSRRGVGMCAGLDVDTLDFTLESIQIFGAPRRREGMRA